MEKCALQGIGVAHLSSGWDCVEPVRNKGWRRHLLQDIKKETVISRFHCILIYLFIMVQLMHLFVLKH
jgi:hypothetical protein